MVYSAVGARCAVVLELLDLQISNAEALDLLNKYGFEIVDLDVIEIARSRIDVSQYFLGARIVAAPNLVDCSSFTKWVYSELGIWIPRLSIQQYHFGTRIDVREIREGDLIFTDGKSNYYHQDPDLGIGHVGIVSTNHSVIHATSSRGGVIETSIKSFMKKRRLVGACRILPDCGKVITLHAPEAYEVENSDDIRYFILRRINGSINSS